MMIDFKNQIITCPHCGREYLAAEIFFPGAVMGKPTNIIRDALGKILLAEFTEDHEPDITEKYICDQCNNLFVIEAVTSYKTKKEVEELDFNNQYTSLLDN